MSAYTDAIVAILTLVLVTSLFFLCQDLIGRLRAYIETSTGWTNGAHAGIYVLRWVARPCFVLMVIMPISWIYNGEIALSFSN